MSMRSRLRALLAAAFVPILVVGSVLPVGAADRSAADLAATKLTPVKRIEGSKAASSRLARTDPQLLARNDAQQVLVMIKFDYDAIASYEGGVARLNPTSPRVTGLALTGRSAAERAYDAAERETAIVLTGPWHARDARSLAERLGAPLQSTSVDP